MSDKYNDAIAKSVVLEDDAAVASAVEKILTEHFEENNNIDVYKFLFNTIDLTTLKATDSPVSVSNFVERVNAFDEEYPMLNNVAAICVYPNFAGVVSTVLDVTGVDIACVSGGFPFLPAVLEWQIEAAALLVGDVVTAIGSLVPIGRFSARGA